MKSLMAAGTKSYKIFIAVITSSPKLLSCSEVEYDESAARLSFHNSIVLGASGRGDLQVLDSGTLRTWVAIWLFGAVLFLVATVLRTGTGEFS
jgi:hypothetical protein